MSFTSNDRYCEVSADWRHRDNLTWQLPTILFAITGAIFAAILKLSDGCSKCSSDSIFMLLYLIGFLLSVAFFTMLLQNIMYQVGSSFYLKRIEENKKLPTQLPPSERVINPFSFGLSKWKVIKFTICNLTGSSILLLFCLFNIFIFFSLFFYLWWYATIQNITGISLKEVQQCLLLISGE